MVQLIHQALRRDFRGLSHAVRSLAPGDSERAGAVVGYSELVTAQLSHHHVLEDRELWPLLRSKLAGDEEAENALATAELEHLEIVRMVERVRAGMVDLASTGAASAALTDDVAVLTSRLEEHLDAEERKVLPLLERYLTAREYARFERVARKETGAKGAAVFFPWILHDAGHEGTAVLRSLPMPMRLLYKRRWRPSYERIFRAAFP
ncbi:MAG: hemerythrin domain-containing protein [Nitrososphaerales archaeon]